MINIFVNVLLTVFGLMRLRKSAITLLNALMALYKTRLPLRKIVSEKTILVKNFSCLWLQFFANLCFFNFILSSFFLSFFSVHYYFAVFFEINLFHTVSVKVLVENDLLPPMKQQTKLNGLLFSVKNNSTKNQ